MAKIRKRGDTYQIDYFDPNGKRIRKSFKRRKDAEAELGKRVSLIAEGRYLDVKKDIKTTLGELIHRYIETHSDQPSFGSWKTFCLVRFKDHFGEESLLSTIRYVDLENYHNRLRQLPTKNGSVRTTATVNREMSCLRHMFNKAVEWELAEQSPFAKGRTLMAKENNQRLRFLTEDEIARLLAECPQHLRRIVECAVMTGMRRQELLTLTWGQVRNGFIYLTKTKTNEPREIPISDSLGKMFAAMRKERGFHSSDESRVFTYAKSEDKLKGKVPVRMRKGLAPVPEQISSIKSAFTSAVRRAGI
jgi:integrase